MFNEYPYTDYHELNTDWIISKIKNVETAEANTKQYAEDAEAAKVIAVDAKDIAVAAKETAVEAKDDAVEAKDDAISYLTDTRDQLNLLQSRVDNIIPDGTQTAGNTELLDIRVGGNGITYDSAGNAVRGQFDQANDAAVNNGNFISVSDDMDADYIIPEFSETAGFRNGTDLTTVVDANYKITSKIALFPGQLITAVTTTRNTYVSMLTVYDEDFTALDYAAIGASSENTYLVAYLNKTNDVQYVSACGLDGSTITIKIYRPLQAGDDLLARKQSLFYASDLTTTRIRFASDWTIANYVCTPPIPLKAGDTLHAYVRCSASIPAILTCDANGGNLTAVVNGNDVTQYNYTAPADCYAILQYRQSESFNVINVIPASDKWNTNGDNNDTRHATICFIYDDGTATDSDIVEIFDSRRLKCGFALMSSIVTNARCGEYLDYQKRGYSMLSHSTDAVPMDDPDADRDTIFGKVLTSKQLLEASGFDIRGWVTPSSTMADTFKPMLEQIYDYGYTVWYEGPNHDGKYEPGGSRPYNEFADSRYDLWRITQFTSTANLELAIDECISNKGFLTIYFHSADLTPAHRTRLENVLDYVKTKMAEFKIKCLAPNEAYDYYFNVRKQDI